MRSHTKLGSDWFRRFDVYLIQTNKQTPKQTNKLQDKQNLYKDIFIGYNICKYVYGKLLICWPYLKIEGGGA